MNGATCAHSFFFCFILQLANSFLLKRKRLTLADIDQTAVLLYITKCHLVSPKHYQVVMVPTSTLAIPLAEP